MPEIWLWFSAGRGQSGHSTTGDQLVWTTACGQSRHRAILMRCTVCSRRLRPPGLCPLHPEAPKNDPAMVEIPPVPTIPGYQLEEVLGQGGFATVYRATHARTNGNLETALKVAHRRGDERLAHEHVALSRVGPPAAPEVRAIGSVSGRPWIAMELIDGVLLSERTKTIDPRQLMLGLCDSVSRFAPKRRDSSRFET